MTDKNLLAGNWKMNLGPAAAAELASQLLDAAQNLSKTDVWVAPAAVSLAAVAEKLNDSPISYGSQNVHWEQNGAFTGEVSVSMIKELGCSFALTGHSERRHVFGETDQLIAQRTLGALAKDFTVIFCIGEKLAERESGSTNSVLETQLAPVLSEVSEQQVPNLVIAYEPVWAIGTGKVATTAEIEQAHTFIAQYAGSKLNSQCPPILYGGSVNPDNFGDIIKIPLVSGALVGGASLKADKFKALIDISEQA